MYLGGDGRSRLSHTLSVLQFKLMVCLSCGVIRDSKAWQDGPENARLDEGTGLKSREELCT
eukprot:37642-Eustigmatos_ZCMA.PRE.1